MSSTNRYITTNKKRRAKGGAEVKMQGGLMELVERFIADKRSFNLVCTSRTKKIITEDGNVFFEDKELRKFKHFYLVNQLKNKILDKSELMIKYKEENFINPYNVEYFDFDKDLASYAFDNGSVYEFSNVIEIDIVKAYYNALLVLGFIDLPFYKKCISIPKADRLRLVGSIATVKTIREYVEGDLVNEFIDQNSLLRDVWFLICLKVSHAMQTLREVFKKLDKENNIKENSFLFYWVDGIYVRELDKKIQQLKYETNDLYADICNELKDVLGFDYKMERLEKIEITNTGTTLELKVYKEEGFKLFFIPDNKIKSYYL